MTTILYAFWGRRENVELQMPYIRRILDEHADIEFHGWDLSRNPADSKYLRSITGDRITVQTAFYGPLPSRGQVKVWRYYTDPKFRDTHFVKVDDDVIFLDTNHFADFVEASKANPDAVVSALTINNGASTPLIPELWDNYNTLNIPLLDVHLSPEYAEMCHRWFHTNWQTITTQTATLTPSETWVSINCIAYTWHMGRTIAGVLGTRSPNMIADREFPRINARGRMSGHKVGDEGAVNMQPVAIYTGMTAGHFTFGPQEFTPATEHELRKLYTDISRQYLQRVGNESKNRKSLTGS